MKFFNKPFSQSEQELHNIQNIYENTLENHVAEMLQEEKQKGTPEFFQGSFITMLAGEIWQNSTDSYQNMPEEVKNVVSEQQYFVALSKSTAKILNKYLDVVPPPFDEYL